MALFLFFLLPYVFSAQPVSSAPHLIASLMVSFVRKSAKKLIDSRYRFQRILVPGNEAVSPEEPHGENRKCRFCFCPVCLVSEEEYVCGGGRTLDWGHVGSWFNEWFNYLSWFKSKLNSQIYENVMMLYGALPLNTVSQNFSAGCGCVWANNSSIWFLRVFILLLYLHKYHGL